MHSAGNHYKKIGHRNRAGWTGWFKPPAARSHNSFVSQTPTRPINRKQLWLSYLVLACLVALAVAVFKLPWLQISEVEVSQNINIPSSEILRLVGGQLAESHWGISQSNLLFFDSVRFTRSAFDNFQLYKIEVKKQPKKLLIKLWEKEYTYIWQEADKYYYINLAGDIILTKDNGLPNVMQIVNSSASRLNGRSIIVDQKYLLFADKLDKLLKANNHGLNDRRFIFDSTLNCIKIQLTGGPLLLFNTESEPVGQLEKLDYLRRNELRDGAVFNAQKYIDLRYGESIFYQ